MAAAAAGFPGDRRITVLIIDDNQLFVSVLELLMFLEGMDAIPVDDPRAALEEVRRHRPDVVLVDHHLPGISGVELGADIARLSPGTPVLLLTADDDPSLPRVAREAGFDGFLDKARPVEEIVQEAGRAGRRRWPG